MPGRLIPLVNDQIYHITNRGVASQPIFNDRWNYNRVVETMLYYQNIKQPQKYSHFLNQAREAREKILEGLRKKREFLVELIAYCFMPNHFHFLLKQIVEGGVSHFLSNFENSYTRYFNTRHERKGPLFQGKFNAVLIETDKQLLHVSRYIHLNPYSSYVVKTPTQLEQYQFSSLPEYLGKGKTPYCQKEIILIFFKKENSYKEFVFDRADYQRKLNEIKHLILEK